LIWPVGVILLWTSPAWSTRDKLIATLVPPGGYLGLLVGLSMLELLGWYTLSSCGGGVDSQGNASPSCVTLPGWEQALFTIAFVGAIVFLLLLPVLVGIYMARRLGRQEA
jgi:hypothetical protein